MLRITRLPGLALMLVALALLPAAAQQVTITYWQYEYATKVEAINTLIDQFEAENPNIRVVHETFPYDAYNQRVAASVPAGRGPDVINLFYGWLPLYIDSGYLQPLPEDTFPPEEIERDFAPMVRAAKMDGRYWALPTAVRTLALFYNKDLLAEAGLDGPPKTWDAFLQAAESLTRRSGNRFQRLGFGVAPTGQDHHLIREVLFRQWGVTPYSEDGRRVTYDTPAGTEALEFYTDWITKQKIGVANFFPGDSGYREAFMQGLAAMIIDGSFAVGSIRNGARVNWGVAELPVGGPTNERSNFGSFWAHGITRNARGAKLDASIKFLKFITSESAMRYWLDTVGEIPARAALAQDPALASDPVFGPFVASLPYAHATFFVDEAGQRQVLVDAVNEVTLQGVAPETALERAAQREQQILDDFWSKR
ncbi:extracellular solute-binding protein [Limnochorda pilosa]|uniref:Sugar ABC transporter substrate-binding protein n=1 Tax=Limnochorda pilosa TaxID=1555112 RepID=A0A0K2SGM6_LIMPI|nr:extracellular solute-binding protein [Limnochorda pilosa]BAS26172.1 sugar ABC transporter substrate-binding protein [Limnochorda pilosa]